MTQEKIIRKIPSRWERRDKKNNLLYYIEIDRGLINSEQLKEKIIWSVETNQEHDFLDFKTTYNFQEVKAKLELVRDIVAIANSDGGFIILGVKEKNQLGLKWHPVGLTSEEIQYLDEARIRSLLAPYVSTLPKIIIDHCQSSFPKGNYRDKNLGIIYIEGVDVDPIFFTNDGNYHEHNQTKSLFQAGDLFIRQGTSSVRLRTLQEWQKIKARWRSSELKEWQEEHLGLKRLSEKIEALIDILSYIYKIPKKEKTYKPSIIKKQDKVTKEMFFAGPKEFEEITLKWLQENE